MPTAPPDAETVRRAVERVFADGRYDLAPRPADRGGASEFFRPLRERLWDPLMEWWGKLQGSVPWADEVLAGLVIAAAMALLMQVIRLRRRPDPKLPEVEKPLVARPDELFALAQSAGERGEYVVAARLLLHSGLLRLEAAERRVNRPGLTNRELLRRYRGTALANPLAMLVDTVDRGWFGRRECSRLDYVDCLAAHEEIASVARPRLAATGAAAQ
jgi:hypothetical protein